MFGSRHTTQNPGRTKYGHGHGQGHGHGHGNEIFILATHPQLTHCGQLGYIKFWSPHLIAVGQISVRIYVCAQMSLRAQARAHVHEYMHVFMRVCTYICICVSKYVYICMYKYAEKP